MKKGEKDSSQAAGLLSLSRSPRGKENVELQRQLEANALGPLKSAACWGFFLREEQRGLMHKIKRPGAWGRFARLLTATHGYSRLLTATHGYSRLLTGSWGSCVTCEQRQAGQLGC